MQTKEEKALYQKKWHEKNPNYHKEYDAKHPEEVKIKEKKYRDSHREKRIEGNIQYRIKNPDYFKNRNKGYRNKVFDHYGWICKCCGENNSEFLTIDHINNNGAEHRKEKAGSGSNIYRWLIKNNFPEGFQTLCYNCNCAKQFRGKGECPHKNQDYLDRIGW